MTTLYDIGGNRYDVNSLSAMKTPELAKMYSSLAQSAGEKPVNRFPDHGTAVKRTRALIEKHGAAVAEIVEEAVAPATPVVGMVNSTLTDLGRRVLSDLGALASCVSMTDAKTVTELERGILLAIKSIKAKTVSDKVRAHIARLAEARRAR